MTPTKKAYFTLEELEERWSLPRRDIAYLAENGLLRLSVRAFGLRIERSYGEQAPEGDWFLIPYDHSNYSGLLDLLERDVFSLFRDESTIVSCFHHPEEAIRLVEPTPYLEVRISDVVVRREERDRAEAEHGLQHPDKGPVPSARSAPGEIGPKAVPPPDEGLPIVVLDDGRGVRLGDRTFRFGEVQAKAVRRLHQAAMAGEAWVDGKVVLHEIGSRSAKISDLFKSKPGWRELIDTDGRGRYRLARGVAPSGGERGG